LIEKKLRSLTRFLALRLTGAAAGVVRNLISAFAADQSFEPTPTPAWKTV